MIVPPTFPSFPVDLALQYNLVRRAAISKEGVIAAGAVVTVPNPPGFECRCLRAQVQAAVVQLQRAVVKVYSMQGCCKALQCRLQQQPRLLLLRLLLPLLLPLLLL